MAFLGDEQLRIRLKLITVALQKAGISIPNPCRQCNGSGQRYCGPEWYATEYCEVCDRKGYVDTKADDANLIEQHITTLERNMNDPSNSEDLRMSIRAILLRVWDLEGLLGSGIALEKKRLLEQETTLTS